ncbi:MAG TPA: penicillin-binding protein activator [Polyangiaceae bacterium]|nr:penicillin-binding protein activator [Polyangiaceae bacterium]
MTFPTSATPRRRSAWLQRGSRSLIGFALLAFGCGEDTKAPTGDAIRIGVSLPFTGKEAALGRNLEQAILLAVQDVNDAGGIDGVPLELVSRDSNSGSERGLNELLDLLYNEQVAYLIGPEENHLANQIVADVKTLNVMNVLPGYAAPAIERSTTSGSWLRLAPSSFAIGCAFATRAADDGAVSANTLASSEDYNASVSAAFTSEFRRNGGTAVPSVSVSAGQSSYSSSLTKVFGPNPDKTFLIAYPATAATIMSEWAITGRRGSWYLSPLLRADAFLSNVPYGALDGFLGMSPSLSLTSECEILEGDEVHGPVQCTQDNAARFTDHFAARWKGTKPFPAAHLYYDAVVLLALGMQYAVATHGEIPKARVLQQTIRDMNVVTNDVAKWDDLESALSTVGQGKALRYAGAGAEYRFDAFGAADHRLFDTWTIGGREFVPTGTHFAACVQFD